jgi:CRISPR-associated protein Csm4
MKTFKFTLEPQAPFATPLAGDTLFGHLCWAAREALGGARLTELLEGYAAGRPFLVVSDGFPAGFLPRPTAPDFVLGLDNDPRLRKLARTDRWLPADDVDQDLRVWLARLAESRATAPGVLTQNTINRLTGTTGTGQFAPRQVDRIFFVEGARLDLYAAVDETRLSVEGLCDLLENVGLHGYGRDATTGLGKFVIDSTHEHAWPAQDRLHRYWLTLAPCAPVAEALAPNGCFYLPLTRFGRHGSFAAIGRAPFKTPVIMMATGAMLQACEPVRWAVHGRGLGGRNAPLSRTIPETVHQGYAPVVPLHVEGA